MGTFVPMFAAASASRVSGTAVTLPDPRPRPSDGRGVSRYPSVPLLLLEVSPRVGVASLDIVSPTEGSARMVETRPLGPDAISTLIEIAPLPFRVEMRRVLSELPGIPTFYIGLPEPIVGDPDEDMIVREGELLGSLTSMQSAFIGVMFQDGVSLAPWAWIERIGNAVQAVDPTWLSLLDLFPTDERHLLILDHIGAPARPLTLEIRLVDAGGGVVGGPWERTVGSGQHDLEQIVANEPLDGFSSLFDTPTGQSFDIRPTTIPPGEPDAGSVDLPVQVLYETATSSAPGARLTLPTTRSRLHLQVLELARWYPPLPAGAAVERYRTNSRVEPLVDGIPTFRRLAEDLRLARRPGCGLHITGWAFNRFPLDQLVDEGDLVDFARAIIDGGGTVRMLANKFVQLTDEDEFIDDTKMLLVALLVMFTDYALIKSVRERFATDDRGFVTLGLGTPLLALGLPWLVARLPTIIEELEPSSPLIAPINELSALEPIDPALEPPGMMGPNRPIAVSSRNPARLRDNPLYSGSLPVGLNEILEALDVNPFDIVDRFGVWHNKAQMVRLRRSASASFEYSGFLGGIDINKNRVDTPAHTIGRPFHDVHCRVTGPAVIDLFRSFEERYLFDASRTTGARPLKIATPEPSEVTNEPARHIARIGRTYFGSNPDGGSNPLPFALAGERSIYDTLLAAIQQASRYIYIEDQYYTPNGSSPPVLDEPSYQAALLRAADRCQRLVILVPEEQDQPFGDRRRRRLFADVRAAWGQRVRIGFPQRRPILGKALRIVSRGRTLLFDDITSATQASFRIGPAARVGTAPFWIWIDGELMLVRAIGGATTVDDTPVRTVEVIRAEFDPHPRRWGATPRTHKKAAPVTHATPGAINVHAKTMMVDDVFVSIGSANLNRRGFTHDGEINAFAIPQQLAAAPDNPARALRTALWAEHLGITPEMGAALLADPLDGFELFRRSPYLGNRFTDFEATDVQPYLGTEDETPSELLMLKWFGLTALEGITDFIWNTLSDPTSWVDPSPENELI